MKKMDGGRQGRRFSLINLRSSSTKPKSVSLSPTVTVLSPSTSTSSENRSSSSSSTSLTVTHCHPTLEARFSGPSTLEFSSSSLAMPPPPPSPALQMESTSATLQLVPVSTTLQRVPSTSASQLQLVPSASTLHLLSAAGSPPSLQLVPASASTNLQLMPSPSAVQRIPSSSSIQRIPSTSSQHQSPSTQTVYTTPQTSPTKSPRSKAREKSSSPKSKSKRKTVPQKTAKQSAQCSHNCPHKKRCSEDSESSACPSEETHLSKKEILTKYRLHIFVAVIFVITLLFVSLGWYYRDKSRAEELSNQKIFIDPRRRILTLSDHNGDEINVLLGRDLPQWQLPLHCPVQTDGNPNSKECEWKNNALLRVEYFVAEVPEGGGSAQCYNVSWETLRPPRVPYDCFDVGTAVWYGPSNQSDLTLPIRGTFDYVPTPYQLSNGGIFSSVTDFYWLSSSGVGLLLNANNPLTLHWNSSVPNHLCVVSNYSGPLYGRTDRLPHMNYTICNGPDPRKTHMIMKSYLRSAGQEQSRPTEDMFGYPQWSVSGLTRKTDYDQQDVRDIVSRLKMHRLNCSLLLLDGDWQENHGDLTFDMSRFANLTNMTDSVASICTMALQVSPYFDYRSVTNFHDGVAKQLFVKDAGGDAPGLTRWQKGPAVAMLDVSLGASRAWFNTLMTRLLKDANAKAVRFSYGKDGWLPYKPTFGEKGISLNRLRSQMTDMVSKFSNRLVLEHTSESQSVHGFLAVPTELAVRNGRSCLVNTIEKALTLGLLGYPYVLADGFSVPQGRQSFLSSQPSRDLFTRWMQMATFFPAYKFSVPPWIYDEETVRLAANLTKLHVDLIAKTIQGPDLMKDVSEGLPILRPLWWADPANGSLHALHVNDEFLIGDSLLVAPVLCEGVNQRSIYVPHGVWSDKLRKTIVLGPKILEGYRVELNEVPYFERMPTYEDFKQ